MGEELLRLKEQLAALQADMRVKDAALAAEVRPGASAKDACGEGGWTLSLAVQGGGAQAKMRRCRRGRLCKADCLSLARRRRCRRRCGAAAREAVHKAEIAFSCSRKRRRSRREMLRCRARPR